MGFQAHFVHRSMLEDRDPCGTKKRRDEPLTREHPEYGILYKGGGPGETMDRGTSRWRSSR